MQFTIQTRTDALIAHSERTLGHSLSDKERALIRLRMTTANDGFMAYASAMKFSTPSQIQNWLIALAGLLA